MKTATMIVDLQYGSTGKGLAAGFLAKREAPDVVVHAFGPNSGHTFIDNNGRKFVHRMLANGVVSPRLKTHLIGPGAVLDLQVLEAEITEAADLLEGVEILIHQNTTILQPRHVAAEQNSGMVKIGSTRKGTGRAAVDRILREAYDITACQNLIDIQGIRDRTGVKIRVAFRHEYLTVLRGAGHVQIEGAQGFSLGIHSGHYPYTTSRECTPAQLCADTLVTPADLTRIVGCMRTFPIRVANRYDEDGNMVGSSGPGYPDQRELDWSDLGVDPEYTTVTGLKRRVFTMSSMQNREAFMVSRPTDIFLGFANYCEPGTLGSVINGVMNDARVATGRIIPITMVSNGPTENDVEEFATPSAKGNGGEAWVQV